MGGWRTLSDPRYLGAGLHGFVGACPVPSATGPFAPAGGLDSRRLNHWPLIVSASLTKAEIYSSAWRRLLLRSVIAVLLLAGLMALIVLGARQAWREAMLMGELEHRVKNAFSSVEALIDRALEDNP